jgi:hypothetical protein
MTEWSGEMITVVTRERSLVASRAYEGLPNLLGNGDAPMSYDYHIGAGCTFTGLLAFMVTRL